MNADARNRFPNLVIRASAGTGKTYQLTNRYLGLAGVGEPLDGILASTFTRKAAGEILDRVLVRLAKAALDDKECAELGQAIGLARLDRPTCLGTLGRMLRHLHRLRIGTLDHFFVQMARSFCLELGLPPGWQIIDEMEDRRLRSEAVREMLEGQNTADTLRLMHLLAKGDVARSVSRQISDLVNSLYAIYTECPAEAWSGVPRAKAPPPTLVETARAALADMAMPDKNFEKARQKDLAQFDAGQWEAFLGDGLAGKILAGEGVYWRKPIPEPVAEAYEVLVAHARAVVLGTIANQTEATGHLLAHFDRAYTRLKLARRALRFEDVTRRLAEALDAEPGRALSPISPADRGLSQFSHSENGTVPLESADRGLSQFSHSENGTVPLESPESPDATERVPPDDGGPRSVVAEDRPGITQYHLEADSPQTNPLDQIVYRLDAHVAHLLLDEFQDTSAPQWRVLRPFARRLVGRGERQAHESFFCVGDTKQAIYGWRGGVAEIFDAIPGELPGLADQTLLRSHRSSPVVIDLVNRVFGSLATNPALGRFDEAARRWAERFSPHATAKKDLPGWTALRTAPRAEKPSDQRLATLNEAARRVAEWRRRAPGASIGVLVRTNRSVARMIFELGRLEVPASEEGGNPLVDSPAVELVLSALALADHPGDTAARFHVAASRLGPALGVAGHEDDAAAWRASRDVRAALATDGFGPTIYAWAERLAEDCDARDLGRLAQLVELAYACDESPPARVDDFVALVRQRKVEDPSSAAVRVMTIHQAKGLEFDVVVLPELDVPLLGQPPQLVVDRPGPTEPIRRVCRYVGQKTRPVLPPSLSALFAQHENQVVGESLCLLYVALTRAVHALEMIIAPSPENEKNPKTSLASVLRAALAGPGPVEPETTLFELGTLDWPARLERMRADAMGHVPPDNGGPRSVVAESQTGGPRSVVAEPTAPAPTLSQEERGPAPLALRLAPPSDRPRRGLDRRSPSQLEGGPRVDLALRMRTDRAALDRGTLLHGWFEQIEWLDDGEPDEATLRRVAERLGHAPAAIETHLAAFRTALAQPAVGAVLRRSAYEGPDAKGPASVAGSTVAGGRVARPAWRVWRERTFAVRDEEAILGGSIDRLVVLFDGPRAIGADVLDFKTDAIAPDDPAALSARTEVYRPQLAAYRRAVAGMFALEPAQISARLVFVAPGVVVEV